MEIRYSSSISYDAFCSEQVPIDLFYPLSKRPHPFNAQFPLPQPRSQGNSLGNLERAGKDPLFPRPFQITKGKALGTRLPRKHGESDGQGLRKTGQKQSTFKKLCLLE